jgi:hypothetical protein
MDLPDVKPSKLLVPTKLAGHLRVMKGSEGGGEPTSKPRPHELLRGPNKILHLMSLLQGVPDPKDRGFLPAIMNIAVEDLKDPEAAHAVSLWRLMLMRKNKRHAAIPILDN